MLTDVVAVRSRFFLLVLLLPATPVCLLQLPTCGSCEGSGVQDCLQCRAMGINAAANGLKDLVCNRYVNPLFSLVVPVSFVFGKIQAASPPPWGFVAAPWSGVSSVATLRTRTSRKD